MRIFVQETKTKDMKIKKGTQESKFLLQNENGYIYKSVTSYDSKYDVLEYAVDNIKCDYGDRFHNLEDAVIFFNENIK